MNISAPFIKRPIATTLLAVGLAIAGIIGFKLLPVAPLPQIDFPTINVQASLPGANPETMATSVATPLERQIGVIAGVTDITSTSNLGSSRISVQFDLNRDINGAARDIQAAINAAHNFLPSNLPINPSYRKANPADAPILILSLTSDSYSTGQMYDAASTILQQKIAQIEGVGQVIVGGSSLPAVRVELNPTALNKYNIGLNDVANVISSANNNRPTGEIQNHLTTSNVEPNDQIFKAAQYSPLIIKYQNNSAVRISDVATVSDSVQDLRNAGLANGKPSVLIIVFKQAGANIIKTVDQIKKILPLLKASIQTGINLQVMMDRTTTIRAALHDVEVTLIISILLVVLVVYFFLANIRAMLIPSAAMTLSLLGTFAIMSLIGYSLDNLSLMALTIATGFVVDDAIVVLENITRHLEAGMKPFEAALQGAKEVGFTVISMSLSLIAVFMPIIFMGGIVGRLFREFAITLSIAIMVSLFLSLTVTPMMAAYFLKPSNNESAAKSENWLQKFPKKMRDRYEIGLQWSLFHPILMSILTLITIVLTILLFIYVPKGFFPQQDTGRIVSSIQAQQDTSFQSIRKKLYAYVDILHKDPAIENIVGFVGGGNNTTNAGTVFITLKPFSERNVTSEQVINRLRGKLAAVPGSTLYMQSAQDIVIGGRGGNAQYQYTLSTNSISDLNYWAEQVKEQLAKIPGIADVNSDQLNHGLQSYVTVDRNTASRFGITSQLIDSTLYSAFGQRLVSTMYTAKNQYYVVMEVAPEYWQQPQTLNQIYIAAPNNQMVPLSAIAKFSNSSTLLSVNHQGQLPSATISFNLLPGTALGDAVDKINKVVKSMHLPESISAAFKGNAQAFQASLASEPLLIALAILAIYIVLGILYESFIHPITILSTLPSAGVGALLALLITRTDLSIIAMIGIILLIGIVKKNAIMMIDFALHVERTENKSSRDAIYEAAVLRFRPIMMTTMAAMFGALPLAIGLGSGSELRRPLGIAIIGGLILSQMLTLFTTPVIYLMMEKFSDWIDEQKARARAFLRFRKRDLDHEF